ncbi:MAG: hypothetical protein U0353_22975 [Sandaracinus sp.]
MTIRHTLSSLAFTALTLLAIPASAQDRGRPPPGHGPPPEALAACRGRSRGASCTVTPPDGRTVSGTCDSPADDLPLACRPEGGPGGPGGPHADARRGPPPEAIAACRSRSAGASCSVTPPGGRALAGTCEMPPGSSTLACRPAGGPGAHGHHGPPPEAFAACDDVAEGDACVIDTPEGTVEGVCRGGPDGRTACAPNRPREPRTTP